MRDKLTHGDSTIHVPALCILRKRESSMDPALSQMKSVRTRIYFPYFVLVYTSGGFFFTLFSFLSATFPSLFYFPSSLFLSLSYLRTLSFASVTCMPFSLDTWWPTSTVTARCLHFPHNTLRFLATGRLLDCVFVFEPVFVFFVFILQPWPTMLQPVFVQFLLITCGMGRVNRINSVQVQTNLRWTLQALIILTNWYDEAWCERTATHNTFQLRECQFGCHAQRSWKQT